MSGSLAGLVLAGALAGVARVLTSPLPNAISEVTVGILLGLLFANTVGIPSGWGGGVKLAVGVPLRIGIVLLGARLTFDDLLATGASSLVVILVCVAFAFALVMALGRILGLPMRLTTLIAVGTAICGNSAIIATAPAIEAKEADVTFAVATITAFGTLALLTYPVIGHVWGLEDRLFGHWVGVAINDTSQVTAAGFAYSTSAGESATIVKLTRNLLIGPAIVLIGAAYGSVRTGHERSGAGPRHRLRPVTLVPAFVIGFVVLAVANTLGWIPTPMGALSQEGSRALILVALVAVGLSTNLRQLRSVGVRPLYVGLSASAALAVLALTLLSAASELAK